MVKNYKICLSMSIGKTTNHLSLLSFLFTGSILRPLEGPERRWRDIVLKEF
jgi:hypothetical protein